jgi:hypothetical protein
MFYDNAVGNGGSGIYSYPYTNQTWTHMAIVLTASSWTVYLNGVAATPTSSSTPQSFLPPNGSYPYFRIGASTFLADSAYMNGSMDEFRFYTSALTASQISALYST